jgi:nucleoside-diphosphate-sugar epimerase
MVKVLVLGANGYIGFAVATALRRDGHRVSGVIRNKDFVPTLQKSEIIPVIGDIKDIKSLQTHIESAAIIVDATGAYIGQELAKAVAAAGKKSGVPKRLIYTSGVLAYGDHKGEIVDETIAPAAHVPHVTHEKAVLAEKDIEGVVVRPGWVYGNDSGRYLDQYWVPNSKGEIEIHGSPDKSWGWIHIDDLADAYARIASASKSLVSGEVFDVVDDTRVTYLQLRVAMARASGTEGKVVYLPAGTDAWSQVMEATTVPSGKKIRKVLHWKPKHGTFFDDIDLYYAAWKAAVAARPKKSE